MILIDGSGWACQDCLFFIAYGEEPADAAPADLVRWHAAIASRMAGLDVVPGGPHVDGCDWRNADCDCECDSFSWSPCDVCGGNLGGSRHAVTFFSAG